MSGFDLQVLWERSTAILPPDKLNLLSAEGWVSRFAAPTWDMLEFSTPGMFDVENVRRATRAAMLAAARNGFEVVAIPGMGTGLGGVDPADAARAMVDELRAHRQAKPATVYLVDIDDEILMCLEEALRLAVG